MNIEFIKDSVYLGFHELFLELGTVLIKPFVIRVVGEG